MKIAYKHLVKNIIDAYKKISGWKDYNATPQKAVT